MTDQTAESETAPTALPEHDIYTKMRVLELALSGAQGLPTAEVIKTADAFWKFVRDPH